MSEQAFLTRCEQLLDRIEDALEAAGVDAELMRNGHVLDIEFDDGSHIVVNGQAPLQEIWLAARDGAHHYREHDGRWLDTRSGEDLEVVLSKSVGRQAGLPVVLKFT